MEANGCENKTTATWKQKKRRKGEKGRRTATKKKKKKTENGRLAAERVVKARRNKASRELARCHFLRKSFFFPFFRMRPHVRERERRPTMGRWNIQ